MITNSTLQKKLLRILASLVFWSFFAHASLHAQGLIFSTQSDDTLSYLPLYDGAKGGFVVGSKSLKPYCPTPYNQGNTKSCVTFSCGYGAFTVQKAVSKGWSRAEATQNAYSAAYIFKQLNSGNANIKFAAAFDFMSKNGICLDKTFSNKHISEKVMPSAEAINEAKKYILNPLPIPLCENLTKVKRILPAKSPEVIEAAAKVAVAEIQTRLAQGAAVMIGTVTETDFQSTSYHKQAFWSPKDAVSTPHAMLIVGYDDTAFEIMNSYGTEWGMGGFIKLKYTDLGKIFREAYILSPLSLGAKNMETGEGDETQIDPTKRESIGRFALRKYVGKTETNGDPFEKILISYNKERQLYEPQRFTATVGQGFQLLADDMPAGKYLYIFSLDPLSKTTVHWPPDARWADTNSLTATYYTPNFGKSRVSPIILSRTTLLTIPAPNQAMQCNNTGEEQLVVLVADQQIGDFQQRLERFKEKTGDAKTRLEAVFGDVLIPTNTQNYLDNTMKINRLVNEPKGWVMPMIIAVKVKL